MLVSLCLVTDCPSDRGQYFLSQAAGNLQVFAVIGSGGILQVYNDITGNYENGYIVNKNNEKQHETQGCTVSNLAVIRMNAMNINHTGFNILTDPDGLQIQVKSAI